MFAAYTGVFTALLTSIYSWRLIFKTFHGNYNNSNITSEEIHESPLIMIVPLIILAIGAIFAGILSFWKLSKKDLFEISKFSNLIPDGLHSS